MIERLKYETAEEIEKLSDEDLLRLCEYWKLRVEEQPESWRENPNHYCNQKYWNLLREVNSRRLDFPIKVKGGENASN
jgi:hypothetical protein